MTQHVRTEQDTNPACTNSDTMRSRMQTDCREECLCDLGYSVTACMRSPRCESRKDYPRHSFLHLLIFNWDKPGMVGEAM